MINTMCGLCRAIYGDPDFADNVYKELEEQEEVDS